MIQILSDLHHYLKNDNRNGLLPVLQITISTVVMSHTITVSGYECEAGLFGTCQCEF